MIASARLASPDPPVLLGVSPFTKTKKKTIINIETFIQSLLPSAVSAKAASSIASSSAATSAAAAKETEEKKSQGRKATKKKEEEKHDGDSRPWVILLAQSGIDDLAWKRVLSQHFHLIDLEEWLYKEIPHPTLESWVDFTVNSFLIRKPRLLWNQCIVTLFDEGAAELVQWYKSTPIVPIVSMLSYQELNCLEKLPVAVRKQAQVYHVHARYPSPLIGRWSNLNQEQLLRITLAGVTRPACRVFNAEDVSRALHHPSSFFYFSRYALLQGQSLDLHPLLLLLSTREVFSDSVTAFFKTFFTWTPLLFDKLQHVPHVESETKLVGMDPEVLWNTAPDLPPELLATPMGYDPIRNYEKCKHQTDLDSEWLSKIVAGNIDFDVSQASTLSTLSTASNAASTALLLITSFFAGAESTVEPAEPIAEPAEPIAEPAIKKRETKPRKSSRKPRAQS
jgi:hypothetical protein